MTEKFWGLSFCCTLLCGAINFRYFLPINDFIYLYPLIFCLLFFVNRFIMPTYLNKTTISLFRLDSRLVFFFSTIFRHKERVYEQSERNI